MLHKFTAKDHPEARGRKPRAGEQQWRLTFALENGDSLEVRVGRKGRESFRQMLEQEDIDDAAEKPLPTGDKKYAIVVLGVQYNPAILEPQELTGAICDAVQGDVSPVGVTGIDHVSAVVVRGAGELRIGLMPMALGYAVTGAREKLTEEKIIEGE